MDRTGTATAVLSISTPGVWFGDLEAARQMARLCNEYATDMAQKHRARYGLFAAMPMPDVDGTLAEIAYALDTLKADGIGLMTSYGDVWPGDKRFAPVYEELNRRKALVYFHPLAPNCCGTLIPGVPQAMLEYPQDTARAVVSLFYGGVFARYPDIRFLFSHAGASIPVLAGRMVNIVQGAQGSRRGGARRHRGDAAHALLRHRQRGVQTDHGGAARPGAVDAGAVRQRLSLLHHRRQSRRPSTSSA